MVIGGVEPGEEEQASYGTAVEAAVASAKHVASAGGDEEEEDHRLLGYTLPRSRKSSTGYLGVYPHNGRFTAEHEIGGTRVKLGSYGSAVEAAMARAKHVRWADE